MQGTYLFFLLFGAKLLDTRDFPGRLPFRHGNALFRGVSDSSRGRRLLWGVTWQRKMPGISFLLSYSDTIISLLVYGSNFSLSPINRRSFGWNSLLLKVILSYYFSVIRCSIFRKHSWLCMSAWLSTTLPMIESIATSLLQKLEYLWWLRSWIWFLLKRLIWSLLKFRLLVWNLVYITYDGLTVN